MFTNVKLRLVTFNNLPETTQLIKLQSHESKPGLCCQSKCPSPWILSVTEFSISSENILGI